MSVEASLHRDLSIKQHTARKSRPVTKKTIASVNEACEHLDERFWKLPKHQTLCIFLTVANLTTARLRRSIFVKEFELLKFC